MSKRFDPYMRVSKNHDISKSSSLKGFSSINYPFWGTPIFGNTHMEISMTCHRFLNFLGGLFTQEAGNNHWTSSVSKLLPLTMNSDIFHDESFGFGTAIASIIPFRCPFPTQNLAGYVFKTRKIIQLSFFKRTCENHLSFLHRSSSSTLMSLSISLIEKCINLRCVHPKAHQLQMDG